MRIVKRVHTARKPWTPPPPWDIRGTVSEGAPRALRSAYIDDVTLRGQDGGNVVVGVYDWMQRLYSHWGLTEFSTMEQIEGVWHILYSRPEWELVTEKAFWLEFVSEAREAVARISREDATQFGKPITHRGVQVWAVPMEHYEMHRRSA